MHELTARHLAAIQSVNDHDVNPVTGDIALTGTGSGEPSLYLLPAAGGRLQPLVAGRAQYGSWHPDGRQLLFLHDPAGQERDDLFLLDVVAGSLRRLTDDALAYMWPRFAPDGRLALICNPAGSFDPHLLNPNDGTLTRLATGRGGASSLVWSPTGRWLGFLRLAEADAQGNGRSALHCFDSATGQSRELALLGGDLFHSDWSWQPSEPEPRLCVPADDAAFQALALVGLDGAQEWLVQAAGDALQPRWSPDGSWLAFLLEQDSRVGLWVQQGTAAATRRELSVGPGLHRQPRWAPDGHSLTVLFESATQPPALWRVPLAGEPSALTHALPDDFPLGTLTASQFVRLPTFDGRSIPALCYRPREANGAAVVLAHGGPTSAHRDGWHADVQLLASRGYTVLAPNVRGSTGFGKAFRDMAREDWGGGDLQDVGAARAWLGAQGFHRVGILGGSYGGYLVLMALTQQPTLWQAGAALFPIANLHTLYQSARPGDILPYLVDQIGHPDERPDFYHERSPINFVEQLDAPLLLLHGANDIRTTRLEAESMAARLAAAGKPHTLHVYPDEGHGFQQRSSREDALSRVLAHFNQHLNRQ